MFRAIFICLPLVAFVFVMLGFVFPSCRALQLRSRTQAAWSVLVLLACSKFLFYRLLGGDEFNPDLPMAVIWLWNWMYSGAMILLVLAVALFFLRRKVKAYLLPVLAWSLAAIGIWNGVKVPDVRVVEVDCPALPASLDGYRILHLADIHVSASAPRWRTEAIVAKANAVGADLIVCTGDVVDGNPAQRFADVEPLKTLKARDGVWFCTGNHEFYNDWDAWRAIYGKWGIRFLRNECVFPHEGIALGGVDDEAATRHWDIGSEQFDVEKVFAVATNGEYRVLLQHRPGEARENVFYGVRLQLSGHTHGGIMPLLNLLVAWHNNGFVRGLYRISDDGSASGQAGRLYVSPGCGQWAGFPIRFFNASEISVLVLRRKDPL